MTINRQRTALLALPAILLVAFVIRAVVLSTQTYVVFLDETFQYFEQAHRLAFGTGVLPWEFLDGIRSWFLPGIIAGLMRLTALLTDEPMAYVRLTRLLCAIASLAVVFVGFRIAERREGLAGAILTGGFCAVWFDLVWFSPAVLTEVLGTHAALIAIWLGDESRNDDPRRLALCGAFFGLAFCLRYQYAPALFAAALWQHQMKWSRWRSLITGGFAVVLPLGGMLDWITWGAPFQSIRMNFVRNSLQGMSAAISTDPTSFYVAYVWVALWPAPILLALAVIGGFRVPALGIAAAVTLIEHTAVSHKEVRFIYLAIAIAPILIGIGCASVLQVLRQRVGPNAAMIGTPLVFMLGVALSWTLATTEPLNARWEFERASLQAFAAARAKPNLCGLAVRDSFYDSGGYTYLHREVPIYFADFDPARALEGTSVTMRMAVMLLGKRVPQFPGASLAGESGRYNYLIAEQPHTVPGFSPVACFDDAERKGRPPLCLFSRPGPCM